MKKLFPFLIILISLPTFAEEFKCPADTMLIDFTPSSTQERMQVCQKQIDGKFIKHGPEIIYNKDGSIKSKSFYQLGVLSTPQKTKQETDLADPVRSSGTASTGKCPANFILVPKLYPYTEIDFCVAKYEMKNDGRGAAVSKENGTPWEGLNRDNSRLKCQSIGPNYDLISNDQWQTIARNIANVATNWDSGTVGKGQLNRGNTDGKVATVQAASIDDANDNCINSGLPACSSTIWKAHRRTHALSNGNIIWDLSGNAWEWVRDAYVVSQDQSDHISKFGASSNTMCVTPKVSPYCGMGAYGLSTPPTHPSGAIVRGGNLVGDIAAGIFAMVPTDTNGSGGAIGFRCVFVP